MMGDDLYAPTYTTNSTSDAFEKYLRAQHAIYPIPTAIKSNTKRGEMKVEIERINNGWLVNVTTSPSAGDPLAQRGANGRHFADTPEAICGMIAEWVLEECKRQEG